MAFPFPFPFRPPLPCAEKLLLPAAAPLCGVVAAPRLHFRAADNSLAIEWCQRRRRWSREISLAFSFRRNETVGGGVLLFVAHPCVFFPEGGAFYCAYFALSPKRGVNRYHPPRCTIILLIKHWGRRREVDADVEEEIAIRICPLCLYPSAAVFTLDECVGCTKGFEAILRNGEGGREGGRVGE